MSKGKSLTLTLLLLVAILTFASQGLCGANKTQDDLEQLKRQNSWRAFVELDVALTGFDESRVKTLFDFSDPADMEKIAVRGDDVVTAEITTETKYTRGPGSLRLVIDARKDGKVGGGAGVTFTIDPSINLDGYDGIGFWLWAGEGTSEQFKGRGDIRSHINSGDKRFYRSGYGPGMMRAIAPGWVYYFTSFQGYDYFPQMSSFSISFTNMLEDSTIAEFAIGSLELVISPPIVPFDELADIVVNAKDWSVRKKALDELMRFESLEALAAILPATNDRCDAVRVKAVEAMRNIVAAQGEKAEKILAAAYEAGNWQVRYSIVECISEIDSFDDMVMELFEKSIYYDNYYLRNFAYKQLLSRGKTAESIAADVSKTLAGAKGETAKIDCIRMLHMIGTFAKASVPQLLDILRDESQPMDVRYWALNAVWWIQEENLTAADWAVGLSLEPGKIHRRLFLALRKYLWVVLSWGSAPYPAI